jgi:hypothetical protein
MGDCIANFVPEQNSQEVQVMESPLVIILPKAEKILRVNPKG